MATILLYAMCVFVQTTMDMNAAKNQRESFESAVTSDDSFINASEGLIAMEEMDSVEDCPLLECIASSERQALPTANVVQLNVLHFELEKEGIGKSGIAQKEDYSLLECTAPLQGQALLAVNAGQSNVHHTGYSRRGISSSVLDEEAQLSLVVRMGPLERPIQTARHSLDSMAGQIGLSVLHRSAPKRVPGKGGLSEFAVFVRTEN